MPKGFPENGINKGWIKKGERRGTQFQKGHKSGMFGKYHSLQSKIKMSATAKKIGLGKFNKGYKHTTEAKKKMREYRSQNPVRYWLGKKMTKKHRERISEANSGDKSYLWKGGISKDLQRYNIKRK